MGARIILIALVLWVAILVPSYLLGGWNGVFRAFYLTVAAGAVTLLLSARRAA